MACCPACGESRWVYPRHQALAAVARSLTGWHAYKCRACGWRGWCRSRAGGNRASNGDGPAAAQGSVVGVRWTDLLHRLELAIRRLATLRPIPVPGAATWVIALVAIGLVMAGVLFSREKPTREPRESSPGAPRDIALPSSAREPVERSAPAELPAVVHVVKNPRVESPPRSAVAVKLSPPTAAKAAIPRSNPTEFRGSLAITSDPSGAVVAVDGRVVGPTPVVLKDVPVGSRVVRIESSGYELWSAAARVAADKETRVNATLQRGAQR